MVKEQPPLAAPFEVVYRPWSEARGGVTNALPAIFENIYRPGESESFATSFQRLPEKQPTTHVSNAPRTPSPGADVRQNQGSTMPFVVGILGGSRRIYATALETLTSMAFGKSGSEVKIRCHLG